MANDQCLVFYLCASNHPHGANHSLIEKALRLVANVDSGDATIQVEPVSDRDT